MTALLSKKSAKALGLKVYFTGKPCRRGHIDERLVSTGSCRECNKINTKTWIKENRERYKDTQRQWHKENREYTKDYSRRRKLKNIERIRATQRKWRAANADRINEYFRAYYLANHDVSLARSRVQNSRRRHKVIQQLSTMTAVEKFELSMLYQEAAMLGSEWHVDHIIPLSQGGEHRPYNMQIVKSRYNCIKGARVLYSPEDVGKHLPEYYKEAA